jgi:hypothetical protein
MTHNSQPTRSPSQRYASFWPPWQGYDQHRGGYDGSHMLPAQQFPGQGPSSPGKLIVPAGPPRNHPVNMSTSSCSNNPPQPSSGPHGRHPISLLTKRFQPQAEPQEIDVTNIADFRPLLKISYDEYDSAEEINDSLDLGGAEGKPQISLT